MLTVREARACWREALRGNGRAIESVPLKDAAGRILAMDLTAPFPYPPFRKSPFDGYALCSDDGLLDYTVVATIGAGTTYADPLVPGQAVRLMTGCAVPDGCDTVVMQEDTVQTGTRLHVAASFQRGQFIIPRGEECAEGNVIAAKGTRLTGPVIAVAAAFGYTTLPVYAMPRITVLTTGRELVMPGAPRKDGQIYNSNAYFLYFLLKKECFRTVTFHHVTDAPEAFEKECEAVKEYLADADVVISTGGVSVGLYDTMPALYERLGARPLYRHIAMRPGSSSYGAVLTRPDGSTVPIFGLSGNPTAAFNICHVLVLPVLRASCGLLETDWPIVTCRLSCDFPKESPADRYLQGQLTWRGGKPWFTPQAHAKGTALVDTATTNGLAYIPKGTPPLTAGDAVDVLYLISQGVSHDKRP